MLHQLNDEQIQKMSLEEKDRWWLENVYRGEMPQLTIRSAITGMFLGGFLCLTNLYIGIKTGWTLGVGITSVILSYAAFRLMAQIGLTDDITLLENNAMQSIATSAGYMTAPLISSIAAYMMVTKKVLDPWDVAIWIILVAVLGVLYAFPLKKRFINDEQMPFPEGKACGIVMDGLHSHDSGDGALKIRILLTTALFSVYWKIFSSGFALKQLGLQALQIPHFLDNWFYKFATPAILGTPLKNLTIRVESDLVMVAAGGLMGIRAGASLMIGAVANFFIIVPILISKGIIVAKDPAVGVGFRDISFWSLWGGVAMMTTSSLFAFFSKPKMLLESFVGFFRKKESSDVLKHIELPIAVSLIGIPIIGTIVVHLTHVYFGVDYWKAFLALPLIFVFTVIAVHSTGLTGITPSGALGKLTQLTYAGIAPGDINANLMTAGINGEVAGNASNLLMDIKPGYMLGGKPRHQAVGHLLGILAGGIVATPVFFFLLQGDISRLGTEEMPMIAAMLWKTVADALNKGFGSLHPTVLWAMIIGGVLGIVFEAIKIATKGRFPFSAVAIGLAFALPFFTSFAMFLGSFLFFLATHLSKNDDSTFHKVAVANQETICAGIIAGGALLDIGLQVVEVFYQNSASTGSLQLFAPVLRTFFAP